MNQWKKKNVLWMLLYVVIYAVGMVVVCVTGAIHPILFVCYQLTAGSILSGVVIHAFRRIKGPGVAIVLSLGIILLFVAIGDAVPWHVIPVIIIGIAGEIVRFIFKYSWTGDVISTVIMSFATFGYYGQIWFNRDYTYECAVEEMPTGYAESLMSLSPGWSLVVVVILGILLSLLISLLTAKIFKLER